MLDFSAPLVKPGPFNTRTRISSKRAETDVDDPSAARERMAKCADEPAGQSDACSVQRLRLR